MNEKSILIDTDILIEILLKKEPVFSRFSEFVKSGGKLSISCLTYYECKRGLVKSESHKRLKIFRKFLENVEIIYFNEEIIDFASKLYPQISKSGRLPGEFDLLIASTAMYLNRVVSTHNRRHYAIFQELFELKLDEWKI